MTEVSVTVQLKHGKHTCYKHQSNARRPGNPAHTWQTVSVAVRGLSTTHTTEVGVTVQLRHEAVTNMVVRSEKVQLKKVFSVTAGSDMRTWQMSELSPVLMSPRVLSSTTTSRLMELAGQIEIGSRFGHAYTCELSAAEREYEMATTK